MKNIHGILYFLIFSLASVRAQQNLKWAKSFAGQGNGVSVTTDQIGNIYIAGGFSGTIDLDPGPGVFTITAVGTGEMYVCKLDANGNFIWGKRMGGTGAGVGPACIRVDAGNNVIVCGNFSGTADFDPGPGVSNLSSVGGGDFFVAKYSSGGGFIWAKSCGSPNSEAVNSIITDIGGNIYCTGYFQTTADFDPGAGTYTLTSNGQRDIFVLKLNSAGNFVWAKRVGGLYDDTGLSIQLDVYGNLWSTGYFSDVVDFDPGVSTYNLTNMNNDAPYLLELDATGNFLLAKALNTATGYGNGYSLTTDSYGNIYSVGFFAGSMDFDPNGGIYNLNSAGNNDGYVSKLDAFGNFVWAKTIGGTLIDFTRGISIDQNNNLYMIGHFQGTVDCDPSSATYTLASNGGDDVYVTKFDENGNFLCAGSFGGVNNESGAAITIDGSANILCTGFYQGTTDFDPGQSVFNLSSTGSPETYIVNFTQFLTATPISTTLCAGSSIILTGQGANTYSWSPSIGLNSTTGTTVSASPTTNITYTVVGKTGCVTTNTTITLNVLPKPNLSAPNSPQKLNCIPDTILLQSASTTSNTTLQWRLITSGVYTPQPFYAKNAGGYYTKVIDISNGCSDSALIIVLNNQIPPNAKITSHIYISPLSAIDTVTCYQPSVTIVGASDTSGVNIGWKSIGNNSLYVNPAVLSSQNNLKLFVKRNDNGCSDSSIIVLVNQNTALPTVITSTSNTELNCSIYTAALSASCNPPNSSALWTTPASFTLSNPAATSSSGKYFINVTDPSNGCVTKDSVIVTQTNQLLITSSADTTVCKNSPASLYAVAIGTVTGINYAWSTGQTSQTATVNPLLTTNYVVTASSSSGCYGADSVKVTVPADLQDSVNIFRSCSVNNVGNIFVYTSGGIPPYKYSINNGSSYSSISSFTNIPFGNYTILIKDSIGCSIQTTAVLNSANNLPSPKFLASTENYKRDTIVLVDISIPKADSVEWILPSQANIIGGDIFNPIIVYTDTGTFVVTMRAHYPECVINATKQIRFGPADTSLANAHNHNGIKSLTIYPNPNDGMFTASIEFFKKQNMCVQIWDSNPSKILQQNYFEVEALAIPFTLSQLLNGNYFLRVIGEYDSRNFYFIINK